MKLIVQKYGGALMANPEKIKKVTDNIIKTKRKGCNIVVVVSASGNTTDILLSKAYQLSSYPDKREMDMLLSTGEQQTIALLAMALKAKNQKAISFTGPQVGIITNKAHTDARIMHIKADKIKKELKENKIVIVAGFQGINHGGDITTLGRGASDLTAVALAHVLKAERCELYKDVGGIYSANPKIVTKARLLQCLSYDDVLEMASFGAEVLSARAIVYAKDRKVPLYIGSIYKETQGTEINENPKHEETLLMSAVVYDKNQSVITVQGLNNKPGVTKEIVRHIADEGINVDMIVQNFSKNKTTDISFTVRTDDLKMTVKILRKSKNIIRYKEINTDNETAKISLIGVAMLYSPGVAASMFEALAKEKINVLMITTSGIKISCVVKKKHMKRAVQIIHKHFNLSELTRKKRFYD